MNQDLFEHRPPALSAIAARRRGEAMPTEPDRHLDDFRKLMQAQHDSARALHEVHQRTLKAPDPQAAHAVYDQAHAAIADHFDDLVADKPDWSKSLRQDLDADRLAHVARLQAKASDDPIGAAREQVGTVLGSYARMEAEGDAGRYADRARRTVLAGASAGLYPAEEVKDRFDDFTGEVERFKRQLAATKASAEAKPAAEPTKSLEAWADELAVREGKRMRDEPGADGGDLGAEIERYTEALIHATPESKPVLQRLTMLLFEKFHDHAAVGQLSDLIDDFADSELSPAQRRESLAKSRFKELYLNEAQLNQTLNMKNAFTMLALALGTGRMPGGAGRGVAAERAGIGPGSAPARPAGKTPEAGSEPASTPKPDESLQPTARQPESTPPAPIKTPFDETDPNAVKAYLNRPLRETQGPDGHVIEKHVAKTEQQLRDRLNSDPAIRASSSFPDEATAERVIHQTLAKEQETILKWLKDPKSGRDLRLLYSSKEPVGISVRRDGTLEICRIATVVIRRDGQGGFYNLTAYPCKGRD